MLKLETFFYESRPYFFIAAAFITLGSAHGDQLRFYSGCLLLGAASYVVTKRRQYRSKYA